MFVFSKKELIESKQDFIKDIPRFVEYLNTNKGRIFVELSNFSILYEDNTAIVAERSENVAFEMFPTIFGGME